MSGRSDIRHIRSTEFFNWEILNWVSLNIYHANIMRIIIIFKTVVPSKPISQLILKFPYFDIPFFKFHAEILEYFQTDTKYLVY